MVLLCGWRLVAVLFIILGFTHLCQEQCQCFRAWPCVQFMNESFCWVGTQVNLLNRFTNLSGQFASQLAYSLNRLIELRIICFVCVRSQRTEGLNELIVKWSELRIWWRKKVTSRTVDVTNKCNVSMIIASLYGRFIIPYEANKRYKCILILFNANTLFSAN